MAVAAVLAAVLAANASVSDDIVRPATERARVVRPVDGDTLVVRLNRRDETVRLLGADAPETLVPAPRSGAAARRRPRT